MMASGEVDNVFAPLVISFFFYLLLSFTFDLTNTSFADCETSFQMEIMNVGGVDDKNTYVSQGVASCTCGDHNPTVVCAHTRAIIAHSGRVRQVESMTSCQSWNGNLAAERGTSQLPATANNLGRSRSSAIHEPYLSTPRR